MIQCELYHTLTWGAEMKINSLLTAGAVRHPDKEALITTERTWTYQQLHDDAAKTASLLKSQGADQGSTIKAPRSRP
jgi:non-ribosomal peptide synthetase component E (peptide arylation enzyme)